MSALLKRLRVLSALLGCLVVVLASLPTVALAWTSSHAPKSGQAIVGSGLCSQKCPSCEGTPCPSEASYCTVTCVGVAPALGISTFVLATPSDGTTVWLLKLATLHGLAPPPDPSPPRL